MTERRDALLDSIHKLGGDMMRLRLLFENVDCRQFLRKDVSALLTKFVTCIM